MEPFGVCRRRQTPAPRTQRNGHSLQPGFRLRARLVALLLVALFWNPALLANEKEKEGARPIPIFVDPEFSFSQIGDICLAPALDLRPDKAIPLYLTERGPGIGFFEHQPSANQHTAAILKGTGYQTVECNPVNATLNDLTAGSDAWLRTLDFGRSNWLFVLAVEEVHAPYSFWGVEGGYAGGTAVVSGFLFEKRADTGRLVWRDRAVGTLPPGSYASARKAKTEAIESAVEVNDAISHLIVEFEPRSKNRRNLLFAVDEEKFAASCDLVWSALKDVLNREHKKYRAAFLSDSDRMVIYSVFHKSFGGPFENQDHLILRTRGDACAMQVVQVYALKHGDDWSDLAKEVRAALAKQ